ncbi:MAG: hypothetical protein V4674_04240 [Patescibacteria group bacterium]
MQTTTVGVFKDRIDAEAALRELREVGVIDTDIAVVPEVVTTLEQGTRSSSRLAAVLAILGALIGGLIGAGVLPGVGPITAVGEIPVLFGLSPYEAGIAIGAFIGLVLGAFLGGLVGIGSDSSLLRSRNLVVLTIHSIRGGLRNILEKYHAQEIREYSTMLS